MLKDKTLTQGIDRLPLETANSKKKKKQLKIVQFSHAY